jgi:hypothetical protein
MDHAQAVIFQNSLEFGQRELSLPPCKPTTKEYQDMLENCIDVVPLRHINKEETTMSENADVFAEESLGFVFFEVLEEPLMENHVEGEIGKGKRKGISLN